MKSLAVLFTLLPLIGCASTATSEVFGMLAAHDHHPVQVAAMVVDLDSGETLLARDAQRLFRPASTQKLLTTSAICRRDAAGEFVTTLAASALPAGAVTLTGCGDPMLSSEDLRNLVGQLRSNGLAKATPVVRVVDPLLEAPRFGEGWMWDDEPSSFMPTLSGACVDRGCVTVEVTPGTTKPTVQLLPVPGPLRVQLRAAQGAVQATRGRYRNANTVTVRGRPAPDKVVRRNISVPDAAQFAGHVLADAMQREGCLADEVKVVVAARASEADQPRPEAQAQLRRSVAEVVTHTNKVSDNLAAEMLLRRLGTLPGSAPPLGPESQALGVATITADLQQIGFGSSQFRIADGSGVSHYNLVSADLLVHLLVDMHKRGGRGYQLFRSSLPVAGVDGTLASRMQGSAAHERVFAKTGTVSAVSNLAGYIDTRTGRRLAFAILCQNFVGPAKPWRDLQDRICAALAGM